MNIDKSLKQEDERLFKQRLQRVHAITGIIFSLFINTISNTFCELLTKDFFTSKDQRKARLPPRIETASLVKDDQL